MTKLTQKQINDILSDHQKWLAENGGERANLRGADLRGANLRGANLWGADLWGADLWGADLCNTNLRNTNLRCADLRCADLWGADLWGADLCNTNLRNTNLRNTNLRGADLRGADLRSAIGNRKEIKTIMVSDIYHINYTKDRLQIGCENHAIADWKEFDDRRILETEGKKALKFWRESKDFIFMTIDKFPAD